jgi:pimeloyl-ACP methyl ester carboxylesterase
VKSFDGTRLFYSVEGRGKPMVFCYGLVCSSLHWTYQIEHFKHSHQAVWFDYRGHQNSDIPKDMTSLTLDTMTRDLTVVLDELKIHDALFLGYRQHPERVQAMVLANGTACRPLENLFHTNSIQTAFKILAKAYEKSPELVQAFWKMQKGNPLARMAIGLGGFNPHLTPAEDVAYYVDQVADMDPAILIHLIQNYNQVDASAWLHTVKVPTLVIAGEDDKIIPVEGQELLHQLIPGSQLEIIRHGSHCPQMDLPDLVNLKIEKFLESAEKLRAEQLE